MPEWNIPGCCCLLFDIYMGLGYGAGRRCMGPPYMGPVPCWLICIPVVPKKWVLMEISKFFIYSIQKKVTSFYIIAKRNCSSLKAANHLRLFQTKNVKDEVKNDWLLTHVNVGTTRPHHLGIHHGCRIRGRRHSRSHLVHWHSVHGIHALLSLLHSRIETVHLVFKWKFHFNNQIIFTNLFAKMLPGSYDSYNSFGENCSKNCQGNSLTETLSYF